jgi:hypothetical protein
MSKTVLAPPSALNHVPSQKQEVPSENNLGVKAAKPKRASSRKQIPTILGLVILFVALVSGVLLFGEGTGVFAPRATPETTPNNIRITNVTDKSFSVSFYTSESTVAFVKYGEVGEAMNKQASDDRDQLSGIVKDYRLHHITVRGLEAGKTYSYTLGTGSSSFDDEGKPYTLTMAAKPSQSPVNSQTVYGNALQGDGNPAEGAVVYLQSEGMGDLSSLVKSSGSWGISLSNAFSTDKSTFATLTDTSSLQIKIQGVEPDSFGSLQTTVASAAPAADITLSQGGSAATDSDTSTQDLSQVNKEELLADVQDASDSTAESVAESSASTSLDGDENSTSSASATDSASASGSGSLAELLTAKNDASMQEPEVLDLGDLDETAEATATTITTTQPQIKATLPANTMVRIVIHSDTAIDQTVQTDASGNFVLDVASLGENLEPGEHTASYTYIDPTTGQEVTKTYSFTVAAEAAPRQLAAASTPVPTATPKITSTPAPTTSPTPVPSIPYGSGNPFTPTTTVTVAPTSGVATSTSSSGLSTRSAMVSTSSGQYSAGSVGTTIALLLGGLFFIVAGVWSYSLATSFEAKDER